MNVVFDLGGVLLTWKPDEIIRSVFRDCEIQQKVKSEIFCHPDWIELDRGSLHKKIAIKRASIRTRLDASEIEKLMNLVPYSLIPIPEMIDLTHAVKRVGNRLFVLSNMHVESIDFIEQKYPFWDVFEGMVISSRIHMVKPELEIFQHLIQKYNLVPEKTILIDDISANLEAASKLGIRALKFENPSQCQKDLKVLGCI